MVDGVPDGFRVTMERRPRAVDVVTLPYPGFPTDLQPHDARAQRGRRRHGDGDRERLRGALDVRQRAAPGSARTSAPTATTRSCGGGSSCLAPRSRLTTSGPARRSCSPGSSRTGSTEVPRCTTSTAATSASCSSLVALGADVRREAGRDLPAGCGLGGLVQLSCGRGRGRAARQGRGTRGPRPAVGSAATVPRMPASRSTARSRSASSAVRTLATGTSRP